MKKVLLFGLFVSVVSHQISLADLFWIEESFDMYYGKFNVIYTEELRPTNAAEIYLGFFSFNDGIDYSDSSEFSLEPSSPSITVERVSPLLDHEATYRLELGSTVPEDLCSIYLTYPAFGVVVYELNVYGRWSTHGSYTYTLDSFLHVKTDGPYTIGPGQTVSLNAAGYYIDGSGWRRDYDPLSEDPVGYATWWLGEPYVGELIYPSTVSYDYLTNQLGLSPGTYTLTAEMEYPVEYDMLIPGYDHTTITIVPEPATLILLAAGGLLVRKKKH